MTLTTRKPLAQILRSEIEKLRGVQFELRESHRRFPEQSVPPLYDVRAIVSMLSDIYQGAERVFQRIAQDLDEQTPAGANWHSALLQQMSMPMKGTRPVVIQPATHSALQGFRKFRHRVRQHYVAELDWDAVMAVYDEADEAAKRLIEDLETFCVFLDQLDKDES